MLEIISLLSIPLTIGIMGLCCRFIEILGQRLRERDKSMILDIYPENK